MLLLVTILLVVVGTISLVIGFVQSSLLPIYISIACSVLAAVVLLIFSRMTAKSQQVVTSGAGPAPLPYGGDQGAPQPAFPGTGLLAGSSSDEDYQPEDRYGSSSRYDSVEAAPVEADVVDDEDFPIERYDSRRVGEILPLLAELDLDELDIVREHEEQGKARATVLARIDQLIDQLEAEDRQEAASRFEETEALPVTSGLDELQEGPEPEPIAPPTPQPVTVAALPEEDEGYFPIEDYDELRASEILPLLPELDDDELEMVQERESNGAARASILRRVETLLGLASPAGAPSGPEGLDEGPAPAPIPVPSAEPEPEPSPAPVFAEPEVAAKAPAKRAATKRAPSKKATTKVVVAAPPPTKVPAVKKAPTGKAGPAAVTSKTTRKAPASAREAPIKKAAGGATKATVTKKKAPAVKASAAKAATKASPAQAAAAKDTAAKTSTGTSRAAKAAKATKATKKR